MAVISIACLGETAITMATTFFLARDLGAGNLDAIAPTLTGLASLLIVTASAASVALVVGARFVVGTMSSLEPSQVSVATAALRLGVAVIWMRLLIQFLVGIEQAFRRYGVMNALVAAQTLAANACLVVIAWRGGRLLPLLIGYLGIGLLALLAHGAIVWTLLRNVSLQVVWSRARSREILRYSGGALLAGLGSAMFGQGDRVIVGAVLGSVAVGVYAAIMNVVGQINNLSALPVQPVLAELPGLAGGPPSASRAIGGHAVVLNAFGACALGAGLVTCAPAVLRFLFGAMAGPSILMFTLAVVIYTLYSLNAAGYYILFALGRTRACMFVQLAAGSLTLLLITIGARVGGLLGAVAGNAGYFGVFGLTVVAMRLLGIGQKSWVRWMVPFVAAFAASLALGSIVAPTLQVRAPLLIIESAVFCGLLWRATRQIIPARVA